MNLEPRRTVGGQARRLAVQAFNIRHNTAGQADQVVMIVADPSFVERRRTGGFDPAQEPNDGEVSKNVVHGLDGNSWNTIPDATPHGVRVGMWNRFNGGEHLDTAGGHTQTRPPQEYVSRIHYSS